jgi:hypothetical protein
LGYNDPTLNKEAIKMITETQVKELLIHKGVRFAQIETLTDVATAAANKHIKITKSTTANVSLYASLKDFEVYRRAVLKSASSIEENDPEKVAAFETQESWFTHDDPDCWAIIHHKTKGTPYLYAVYNGANSTYYIDGVEATKEQVAEYLTPSASKTLLNPPEHVENKTHGIVHDVIVRTINLENVKEIRANGEILQA